MQLVEQVHLQADLRFAAIDAAAFKANRLYNAANYLVRLVFIFEQTATWVTQLCSIRPDMTKPT